MPFYKVLIRGKNAGIIPGVMWMKLLVEEGEFGAAVCLVLGF